MRQLLVFAAIVTVAAAGQGGEVDEALLARVAQILGGSSGGAGSFGGGNGGGAIPSFLSSGPSSSYGAPSQSYGAPSDSGAIAIGRSAGRSGGGVQIGTPERAQRVAEFDLSSGGNGGFGRSSGPSSSYGAPAPAPSNQYGAPGGGDSGAIAIGRSSVGRNGGGIQIGRPERAQQVAQFELSGGSQGGFRSGGSQGYQ